MNTPATPPPITEPSFWRELVRPQESLKSLLWDGTSSRFVDLDPEVTAAVNDIDEATLRRINFAKGDVESVTTVELHRELTVTLSRLATAEQGQLELLAFAVIASWLPDRTLVAPTVVVTAQSRAELLPIALFLFAVCRNSQIVVRPTKITLPGSSITTVWDATAASENDVTRFVCSDIEGFSLVGTERIWQRGSAFILGTMPEAEAVIHIRVGVCHSNMPTRHELGEIALKLQPKLLGHRFRLLAKAPPVPKLTSSLPYGMAIQIQGLQAAIDCSKLQAEIVRLVECDRDLYLDDVLISVRGAVTEALFCASHRSKSISCGEIAELAADLLTMRQEPFRITGRRVGSELSQLGFHTKAIPGGRGVVFEPDVKHKLHELAFELDLPATRNQCWKCRICESMHHQLRSEKSN